MATRLDERLRPITPALAWRVAVLGVIAVALFATVFFRLWYLQVLTGSEARVLASQNGRRVQPIEAPRGDIVDRNGEKLVTTRRAAVIQLVPSSLPQRVLDDAEDFRTRSSAAERERQRAKAASKALRRQLDDDGRKSTRDEVRRLRELRAQGDTARAVAIPPIGDDGPLMTRYRRISEVIKVSQRRIHELVIRGIANAPYANITIRTDVPPAQFNYMRERPEYFTGIVVTQRFVRSYPQGELAAQLFTPRGGLEARYDDILRGKDGSSRLVVNALGTRDERREVVVKPPVQGRRLKLTLDVGLQKAGDAALQRALAASEYPARAGAYVAMDADDGAILATGSFPRFDVDIFSRPISNTTWDFLTSDRHDAPLLNRAIASEYPIGSTFKPVTALATLGRGLVTPAQKLDDPGHWEYGGRAYQNARQAKFGHVDVSDALKVSSDIFFFKLGALTNDHAGQVLQTQARRLGFGRTTGIDLPGELPGLVPDARWRDRGVLAYQACTKKEHVTPGTDPALYVCGGIDRGWSGGDNVNLAVGQGDLQATPVQLAVAYAALANDGTIVTPHLAKAVEDANGFELQRVRAKPRQTIKLKPRDRAVVLDGLRRAVREEHGTSADVFKGWPMKDYPVWGKTGTAERGLDHDQAWYVCFARHNGHTIVVVVTVEDGGFGASTAAPAARLILAHYFGLGDRGFHTGSDATL